MSRRAARCYRRTDADTARRLNQCFNSLENNPFAGDVRPIVGRRGFYRYRVGDLRVIFSVNRLDRLIDVVPIAPRGENY
ncbi:MAG: type II toxin-antitoxin system RelE/ParE family toxin [Dehalococcoidia bacterium]